MKRGERFISTRFNPLNLCRYFARRFINFSKCRTILNREECWLVFKWTTWKNSEILQKKKIRKKINKNCLKKTRKRNTATIIKITWLPYFSSFNVPFLYIRHFYWFLFILNIFVIGLLHSSLSLFFLSLCLFVNHK